MKYFSRNCNTQFSFHDYYKYISDFKKDFRKKEKEKK